MRGKTFLGKFEFWAVLAAIGMFLILPGRGIGIILLWLASSIVSRFFSGKLIDRAILTFLLAPSICSLLGLALSLTGQFSPLIWLICLTTITALAYIVTYWRHDRYDELGEAYGKTESVHWLEYVLTIVAGLAGAGWSIFWNPYAMMTHGHYWSINDGGWFIARYGVFPWLDPWRISHFNDHLYYNPAMTFMSASCHLFCNDDLKAAQLVNTVPGLFVCATLLVLIRLSQLCFRSERPGLYGFLMLFGSCWLYKTVFVVTHDTLIVFSASASIYLGLRWLRNRATLDAAGFGISLFCAGMVRPYLGPYMLVWLVFVAVVVSMKKGCGSVVSIRDSLTVSGKCGLLSVRIGMILAICIAGMVSWNALLWIKYGSPVYPHGAGIFHPPDSWPADLRIAVDFFAGTNPGYDFCGSRWNGLRWLEARIPSQEPRSLFQYVFFGEAFPPVMLIGLPLCLLAFRRGGGVERNTNSLLLITYAIGPFALWLAVAERNASPKLLLPAFGPLFVSAGWGVLTLLRRVEKRFSIVKGRETGLSRAVMLFFIGFLCIPALAADAYFIGVYLRTFRGEKSTKIPWQFLPAECQLDRGLFSEVGKRIPAGGRTLLLPWAEPCGGYLIASRPYWQHLSYENPETYRLHHASTRNEVILECERLGIRWIVAFRSKDNTENWRRFLDVFRGKNAQEMLPDMLFDGPPFFIIAADEQGLGHYLLEFRPGVTDRRNDTP